MRPDNLEEPEWIEIEAVYRLHARQLAEPGGTGGILGTLFGAIRVHSRF